MPLEDLSVKLETIEELIKEKEGELEKALKGNDFSLGKKISQELYELNLQRARIWNKIKEKMRARAFGVMLGILSLLALLSS